MTFVAYEPEPPMFESIHTAFQRITAPTIGCRISADPKGPVNQIVSLVVGDGSRQRTVKSALWHIPVGAKVAVERETGGYTLDDVTALRLRGWGVIPGGREPEWTKRPRGWYVTVDGRTVLYASDAEIWPAPKPIPVGALKTAQNRAQAAFRWLLAQPRAATDRLARRLGYHREDECTGWDE